MSGHIKVKWKNLLIANVFDVLREYQYAFDYYSVKLVYF